MQACYQALARIVLQSAAVTPDAEALDRLDIIRLLEHLLPAFFLNTRMTDASQQLRAWGETFHDELGRFPAGVRMVAYALVPAARRVYAEAPAKSTTDDFLAMLRDKLLLAQVIKWQEEASQRRKARAAERVAAGEEEDQADEDDSLSPAPVVRTFQLGHAPCE